MRGRIQTMQRNDAAEPEWIIVRGIIRTSTERRRRRAWVRLEPDDYDRALRAHGQGLDVRVAGTLTRTELRPTEYFRVI
jgi:hypothetical protein